MLADHARKQLCFIISQYGRTIIDDERRCRGLLKDLAPNHKLETNLLFQALEQKIAAELSLMNTIIPLPLQLDIFSQRLHENCGIQLEFAYWAVESWAIALNVIRQPLPKQDYEFVLGHVAAKKVNSIVYNLGDILADGGIIFHLDASRKHGLAAQSTNVNKRVTWVDAMHLAEAHGLGYHLPTKKELNLLYQKKAIVGGFSNTHYWSSTEYDSNFAWYQHFFNGNQNYNTKYDTLRMRAIRVF